MNKQDTENSARPLIGIETDAGVVALARLSGVAVHTSDGGQADSVGSGVAYCEKSGEARANAKGVAYVSAGGFASSGDGGVSVCRGGKPSSSCESWGVAFAASDNWANVGRVKGGVAAVLVLSWVDPLLEPATQVRAIQVGSIDTHGTEILPGRWYTLDERDSSKWIQCGEC